MKKLVVVILGSQSDLAIVKSSKMPTIFEKVGVPHEFSIISAHRNPNRLEAYCLQAAADGTQVFIGTAGMAAALPGTIAAILLDSGRNCPVIGVPLPSEYFPGAQDALLAMLQMPPGVPVAVCGIGKTGLDNAALMACKILSLSNDEIKIALRAYMDKNAKQPEFNITLSAGKST